MNSSIDDLVLRVRKIYLNSSLETKKRIGQILTNYIKLSNK